VVAPRSRKPSSPAVCDECSDPSAEELIAQLQGVKHQHQEYFTPAFELLLRRMTLQDTKGADENFHFSLNTPPYEGYDAQPIEKAWHSKNYVALTPEAHTKMADLKRLLRESCYGVKKTVTWQEGDFKGRIERKRDINHPGVDAGHLVAHTHSNINAWIKADGVLKGTVDDLYEVPNADAKALQQLVRPSLVVHFASSPDVSEDDEEEIYLPEPEDLPIRADSSVLWFHGSMVPWFHGSVVSWFHGSMVPWFHGSMVQWFRGSIIPWFHGSVFP
jgi:hypothetical protein